MPGNTGFISMSLRKLLGALCAAATLCAGGIASAVIPASEQTTAIEFYHAGLDHYFITAEAQEIADLDTGKHPGWARTGYRFAVIKAGSTYPGTVPMCRFYSPTLSSHFYTAKPQECEEVKAKFPLAWQFESGEVFRAFLVDSTTGACPADTTATYRLFNKRSDVNHRYTDQLSAFVYMVGKGYQPEGDGNPAVPIVFCTPAGGDSVPAASADAPACTLAASSGSPALGANLALSAACTNSPTSYLWTNCSSTQATCNTTKATAGAVAYTLYAANDKGPGQAITINVNWGGGGGGGGALPICQISASTLQPTTGANLTLNASCNQGAAAYEWLECNYLVQAVCNPIPNCAATSTSCTLSTPISGFHRYMVAGTNASGTGPRIALDIEWLATNNPGNPGNPGNPSEPPPVCNVYASDTAPIIGSTIRLTASCSNSPTSIIWGGASCSNSIYCSVSSNQTGTVTYSVYGQNGSGAGGAATIDINWQAASQPNPTPVCSLAASNPSPSVGTSVTITSSCTNSPSTYSWTGCLSTAANCTDSAATVGTRTYTLVATNASGSSQPASISVTWGAVPTQPPVCSISASSITPKIGETVTFTASCTGSPTTYQWTNCIAQSGTAASCSATASAAGPITYYVAGQNQYGYSNAAGITVTWQPAGGGGGGGGANFCGSNGTIIDLAWGSTERFRTAAYGGFAQETMYALRVTVPTTASAYRTSGYTSMAEYNGPPALRHMTISKSACDFRDPDYVGNGANGPLDATAGTAVLLYWNVASGSGAQGLVPGETYYFNFKNITCGQGSCEASSTTNWPY